MIQRNVLEDPGWYTAYTPYQPEISQGRLEALLNFQTMVSDLTGTELANASLLDEPTAAAEAMAMARRLAPVGASSRFVVDDGCHPHTIAVVQTRAEPLGIAVEVGDATAARRRGRRSRSACWCRTRRPPERSGICARSSRTPTTVARSWSSPPISSPAASITPPGEQGADIVVGSAQRFGVPIGFGGPHAGLHRHEVGERPLASRPARRRVAGRRWPRRAPSRAADREQHIRREKATSNICTAQVLLAVVASMYAVYHGPDGLKRIATRVRGLATTLAAHLRNAGIELAHDDIFDTVCAVVPGRAPEIVSRALEEGVNIRAVDRDRVVIAVDETTTVDQLQAVATAFGVHGRLSAKTDSALPALADSDVDRT